MNAIAQRPEKYELRDTQDPLRNLTSDVANYAGHNQDHCQEIQASVQGPDGRGERCEPRKAAVVDNAVTAIIYVKSLPGHSKTIS
jgi:hypothetical protein